MADMSAHVKLLQQQDPDVEHIVVWSQFVVAYHLQQEPPNPGWRKANIEGPVFLVRRCSTPRYQLLVKNQMNNNNDLVDNLHPDWELDCQTNYVFYKVEDTTKKIRGLWFHQDSERQKVEAALEKVLTELRSRPEAPLERSTPPEAPAAEGHGDYQYQGGADERVFVSPAVLRQALHSLSDDEGFTRMFMQKLREASQRTAQ
mmetsp:Transcript_78504/g.208383  ORF Transcript_78504/g.208383 Transcript_78504/m.208383 type:complete len:202 (-) Transcript_78504:99-704(-)